MANIVLVHGAFHGGWCWRDPADRLTRAGHRVFAPTLTGLGERVHLMSHDVDLDMHIEDIVNVIEWEELDDVVLVGHSYGGLPITGAADRCADRIAALVYLDAYTPNDGDSAMAVRSAVPGYVPLAEPKDGLRMSPPPAKVFGLTGTLGNWVDRRMTPHPLPTMTQNIKLTGAWRNTARKVYVRCRQFPAPYFDAYYDAAAADPAWTALADDWPHNIMMTDPDWFTDMLSQHVL
jgi:pimeloyl-ACP methyl ester carboxylesterase